jgi:hypothetical protein
MCPPTSSIHTQVNVNNFGKSTTLFCSRLFIWLYTCAGIFKQSMGAGNRVGIGLSYWPARVENLSSSMGRGIDSRNRV